jgi:hypothetical protein
VWERGMEWVRRRSTGEHGARGAEMRRDVGIGYQCCCDGCEGDEEFRAKVCAKTGNEASCGAEGYFFFDVEVETIELVARDDGLERGVVCFKLYMSCWPVLYPACSRSTEFAENIHFVRLR